MHLFTSSIRSYRRLRRRWRRENGNIIVMSALMMTVFMGMLALTIDIGFLAGQRRFMQNGADAGALAAARLLSNSVTLQQNASTKPFPTFYAIDDASVRARATDLAQRNQNVGVTTRTTNFSVLLQYCVAPNKTSYDYQNCPNWVASPTADGQVPNGTYMVRVTASSTITTLFAPAAGMSSQTSTTGNAVAMVLGACPLDTASGKLWPFTVKDTADMGTSYNTLYPLWNAGTGGSWKNVLDLTDPSKWCNGSSPDYAWAAVVNTTITPNRMKLVPPSVQCANTGLWGGDSSWNLGEFVPDPRACYVGNDNMDPDIANWAGGAFNGTLKTGMKLPTYKDAPTAGGGSLGANIAKGIYGSPTPSDCGTYFFADPDGLADPNPAYAAWGPYKDVVIFTWGNPETWNSGTNTWQSCPGSCSGGPNRVQLIHLYNFRIYKNYTTSNSEIWGRIIGKALPPDTTVPTCGGPSIHGNIVRMGQ
ncbi:MAG TPA: pilus assembly protein TadG-related protein [Herpetosiphonaceae bacterium]|nr:pilus assembly protein TadG-related protein [Herpetosiphonaceae bacterium]